MVQAQTSTAKSSPANATHTLDSLAGLDVEALGRVYAAGAAPTSVGALDGHPRGRMLAVRGLDRGPIARALSAMAGARAFPWGGKSFATRSANLGTGVNRVHFLGRHQLFPFVTRVGPSAIDGAPAVVFDYDLPDNPAVVRRVHDEVREVSPGLFLGPALWKAASGPQLVLWFALDANDQQRPIVGIPG